MKWTITPSSRCTLRQEWQTLTTHLKSRLRSTWLTSRLRSRVSRSNASELSSRKSNQLSSRQRTNLLTRLRMARTLSKRLKMRFWQSFKSQRFLYSRMSHSSLLFRPPKKPQRTWNKAWRALEMPWRRSMRREIHSVLVAASLQLSSSSCLTCTRLTQCINSL